MRVDSMCTNIHLKDKAEQLYAYEHCPPVDEHLEPDVWAVYEAMERQARVDCRKFRRPPQPPAPDPYFDYIF